MLKNKEGKMKGGEGGGIEDQKLSARGPVISPSGERPHDEILCAPQKWEKWGYVNIFRISLHSDQKPDAGIHAQEVVE